MVTYWVRLIMMRILLNLCREIECGNISTIIMVMCVKTVNFFPIKEDRRWLLPSLQTALGDRNVYKNQFWHAWVGNRKILA